jgi:hypothetical protein
MPVTTTRPPRPSTRTARGNLYNPAIPSDGLTLDTDLGPVDLVAVARAKAGHRVELTEAELTHLALDLGVMTLPFPAEDLDARLLAAAGLDLPTQVLAGRITYRVARHHRALTARKVA